MAIRTFRGIFCREVSSSLVPMMLLMALGSALLAGCGYSLVGRGSNLPEDVRNVYLEPFANRTPRQEVDQTLTRLISDELLKRQRFNLVSGEAGADAALRGSDTGFAITPITFDDSGRASEYEISIIAQVVFQRTDDSEAIIWKSDRYQFRSNFEVDVSDAGFIDREDAAIEEASERFAETMVSDLLEGF